MNEALALKVIEEAVKSGVVEFCICPGARNSPFYILLMQAATLKKYFWYEERSAAFFSLGRTRASGTPVAVITTSGTAAGELLPAAMEGYYSGTPILLITADRPRRFRGSGAPQSAEQKGLFGVYTPCALDIADGDDWSLEEWDCTAPGHLNVCFEEPFPAGKSINRGELVNLFSVSTAPTAVKPIPHQANDWMDRFLQKTQFPFVVVGALKPESRESVVEFLLQLNAPLYVEGISGIREDRRLQHLRIQRTDGLWNSAEKADYPIDGILRIGGVPTFRLWRDVEEKESEISVCSLSEVPFSGLSWGDVIHVSLDRFFQQYEPSRSYISGAIQKWIEEDRRFADNLKALFAEEPFSEQALMHQLSMHIPKDANIYLGNSLPIREWDIAADFETPHSNVSASRGVNGIDGQISTFLGLCHPHSENWAILGDLTALYDLAAPWILPQLNDTLVNIVVINNGGGQIFSRFLPDKEFLNAHDYDFAPFAQMWRLDYERWSSIPNHQAAKNNRLIEIVPDPDATERFAKKLAKL